MISITRTDTLLDIRTTSAKVNIAQPRPDMRIDSESPKVIIESEQLRVQIDQRQCFNESGLKDYATLSRDYAAAARQAVLEGISRRVSEGNMLSDIAKGGNAFVQIAVNNSTRKHVFGIVTMPMSRPAIDFTGGTVDIKVEEGYVDIRSTPNKPVIEVDPGQVDIAVSRYPDIKVQYIGSGVDILV